MPRFLIRAGSPGSHNDAVVGLLKRDQQLDIDETGLVFGGLHSPLERLVPLWFLLLPRADRPGPHPRAARSLIWRPIPPAGSRPAASSPTANRTSALTCARDPPRRGVSRLSSARACTPRRAPLGKSFHEPTSLNQGPEFLGQLLLFHIDTDRRRMQSSRPSDTRGRNATMAGATCFWTRELEAPPIG